MSRSFLNLILAATVLAHELQLVLPCGSRCTQKSYEFGKLPGAKPSLVKEDRGNQSAKLSEDIYSIQIKFRVSARGLTAKPFTTVGEPDAYPMIWSNDKLLTEEDICMVPGNQNPNWKNEFTIDYDEGGNDHYIKVEVWDEEPMARDNTMGYSLFYVKDMLIEGRTIESTLWKKGGNFHVGTAQITTISATEILKSQLDTANDLEL